MCRERVTLRTVAARPHPLGGEQGMIGVLHACGDRSDGVSLLNEAAAPRSGFVQHNVPG